MASLIRSLKPLNQLNQLTNRTYRSGRRYLSDSGPLEKKEITLFKFYRDYSYAYHLGGLIIGAAIAVDKNGLPITQQNVLSYGIWTASGVAFGPIPTYLFYYCFFQK